MQRYSKRRGIDGKVVFFLIVYRWINKRQYYTGLSKHYLPGRLFCTHRPLFERVLIQTGFDRIIAFRYIPNSIVTRPVEAIWIPLVQNPWYKFPYRTRLAIGWLCLLAIVFGSAFGFKLENVGRLLPSEPYRAGHWLVYRELLMVIGRFQFLD